MPETIDTTNKFAVGIQGDYVMILRTQMRLTKDEALNLAAYLVLMAEDDDHVFGDYLDAMQAT